MRRATVNRIPAADAEEAARAQVNKMIGAIIWAILDASPWMPGVQKEVIGDLTKTEGERMVSMDAALTAMAYLIAAIGVQTKIAENRIATKAFVHRIRDLIEGNIKILHDSGDETPFADQTGMFRQNQRH
jgi:hypothetical protein